MIKDKNLRLYETLAHEVAMEASASAKRDLTDEQRELSRSLLARTHLVAHRSDGAGTAQAEHEEGAR